MTTTDTPNSPRSALAACQSKNLREYCGWRGNDEDDIVTTGTIYHDTASKGYSKSGKRVFKDCYRAEITISGQRYRHRSKDRKAAIKREQCREPRFRALPSVSRLAA